MTTEDGYELVKIDSQSAMNAPKDVYFDTDGVSAYSCLIPENNELAKRVHFVSGADGDEYGQFTTKDKAKAKAASVVRNAKQKDASDDFSFR
ncbi:hypothetical protein [Pseudomonas serbica]|jgi:hypothetical protein|uniref:hypothetical protein n=1 Tax=Pseudomonas serbica TaxID=2965074 RepID=UPI00237A9C97|nr:hypothetical protein [Pseudomonas serbica]